MSITWTSAQTYVQRPVGAQYTGTPYGTMTNDSLAAALAVFDSVHAWGYLAVDLPCIFPTTTLSVAVSSTTTTTWTVASATSFVANTLVVCGTEVVLVVTPGSTTITVQRGYLGTTATTHANGTLVAALTYPAPNDFHWPLAASLNVAGTVLALADQKDFDQRSVEPGPSGQSPTSLTIYQGMIWDSVMQVNPQIRLNVPVTASDTMLLRYKRHVTLNTDFNNKVDVPETYAYAVLDWASAHFAQRVLGPTPMVDGLWKLADVQLGRAIESDRALRAPRG